MGDVGVCVACRILSRTQPPATRRVVERFWSTTTWERVSKILVSRGVKWILLKRCLAYLRREEVKSAWELMMRFIVGGFVVVMVVAGCGDCEGRALHVKGCVWGGKRRGGGNRNGRVRW